MKIKSQLFKSTKKPGVKVCLLILSTIIIYYSVIWELGSAWLNNHYYYHGFMIPLISLFLIWRDRNKIREIKVKPSFYGFLLSLVGVFVFILDHYFIHELSPAAFSMLIFLSGMILLFFGKGYFKATLFPIFFLLFMIPIPDSVLNLLFYPLQLIASKIGEVALHFLGIPVFREGIYLELAPVYLAVDKSCSSMHSLIALSAFSSVIAYLMVDSVGKRVVIFISSIPLAILANGLRLTLIILLALWQGEKIFDSFLHPLSGKLFFIASLSMLILESAILNNPKRPWAEFLSSIKIRGIPGKVLNKSSLNNKI